MKSFSSCLFVECVRNDYYSDPLLHITRNIKNNIIEYKKVYFFPSTFFFQPQIYHINIQFSATEKSSTDSEKVAICLSWLSGRDTYFSNNTLSWTPSVKIIKFEQNLTQVKVWQKSFWLWPILDQNLGQLLQVWTNQIWAKIQLPPGL